LAKLSTFGPVLCVDSSMIAPRKMNKKLKNLN